MRTTPSAPPCPYGLGVNVEVVWREAWEAGFKTALKSFTTVQMSFDENDTRTTTQLRFSPEGPTEDPWA